MTDDQWNSSVVIRKGTAIVATTGGVSSASFAGRGGSSSSGALVGVGPTRHELLLRQRQDEAGGAGGPSLFGPVLDLVVGEDVSSTFWRPNTAKGERGLLEALARRTSANSTYILVCSRFDEELAQNFSTPDDRIFNINHDLFKLSRTAMAFGAVDAIDDTLSLTGRDIKSGLRSALPGLQTDEYYLLKYRDYSDWAVKNFASEAKRDRMLGPKHVERCFALRVGASAGVLIPITEGQLIFGHELLLHQAIASPANHQGHQDPVAVLRRQALNTDQFRSIGVVVDESAFVNPTLQGERPPSDYVPPHPWDWSPSAVRRRAAHFLDDQYRNVGRFVVRGAIVVLCCYVASTYVRSITGGVLSGGAKEAPNRRRRGPSSSSRGGGEERQTAVSLLGAFFGGGPKEAFDYVLAPRSYQ